MGVLIRWCGICEHFHGRITKRCLEPGCRCTPRPEPQPEPMPSEQEDK